MISTPLPMRMLTPSLAQTLAFLILAAVATAALGARADSLIRTYRIAPAGVDPNGPSGDPSIGGTGRYVAFASEATNLEPAVGSSRTSQVYLFDFDTGRATLISSGSGGASGNGPSTTPSVSGDGHVVAFASSATNLVGGTPQRISEKTITAFVRGR